MEPLENQNPGTENQVAENLSVENQPTDNQPVNNPPVEDISSLTSKWEEERKGYESTLQEYKEKAEKFEKVQSDYFTLLDHYDGSKVFANEHIRKQNEILKQFPDKDPSVISAIVSRDINSLSGNEALILADKLSIGSINGVTDNDRLLGILEDLGLSDAELTALEGKDKYRYEKAVTSAKQQLIELTKKGISDNSQFDIEAVKKARTEHLTTEKDTLAKKWNPVNDTLLKAFEGYKQDIKDEKGNVFMTYKYMADDKFRQEYASELTDTLINADLPPTKENYQLVYNLINEQFFSKNKEKIINDIVKQTRTKMEEEHHKLVHNDKPTEKGINQAHGNSPEGKTPKEWALQRKTT
jgi:hypothetical protein